MHIKSILLDGFKSYGNRVEVTGFDSEFNAITGLNGTGKSNILDSICFVLGITNLSNVRAGSLQELIYKHGQAGITKATVSITFDNRDKKQCPIGYENHDEITVTRQVVMGGKNKYLINGINVQNKRVSDLFCSVQLNVNNPHFLIMQGRITKVLNMKPPEILSMVEEAAGTRMYEAKKQAAEKTIEKKDAKLRELNDIIKEDIAPKLQKLQDERAQFQEYQKVVRELDNLTRLHVAWKYVTAEQDAKEAGVKVKQVEDDITSKKEQIKSNEKETKDIDKQVAELNKKLDEESGSVLKDLESELQVLEKSEASANSNVKAAKEAVASHTKKARLLEKVLADDEQALRTKKETLGEVSSTFESLSAAQAARAAALSAAQAQFLAASAGQAPGDRSLQDQLIAAKQEASEASTRISQSSMEKKHAEGRLKQLEKEFQSSRSQFQSDQDNIDALQAAVARLQGEVSSMEFSESRSSELKERVRGLQGAARAARDVTERLGARLQRCDFKYSPPTRDFDHSKVAGTVCRLISVLDPQYCTALETAAGGRLYNVVVDSSQTSRALLQRGELRARTTIIPLDKISAHVLSPRIVQLAQQIGGGPENVQLALDLISYPEEVSGAMQWVFGSTLVCRDLGVARRVTFDARVRRRCVTLDGDVCDPAGTLAGGARIQGGSVLVQLQELKEAELKLQALQAQLSELTAELGALQGSAEKYAQLQQKLEMDSLQLELVRGRLATTQHAQLHAEITQLRAQVSELTASVESGRAAQREAGARAAQLEARVKDIKGHREREFKKAEQELQAAKKAAEEHDNNWKQREQEFETLRLELQELENSVKGSREQIEEVNNALHTLKEDLTRATEEHQQKQGLVKELQSRIKRQKAEIASRSGDISRLAQKKEQLGRSCADLELRIKELLYTIKETQTEARECDQRIKSLESSHPWISSEREYFGAAGGLYDFSARDAAVTAQRVAQLGARRERLQRGLNARAHHLLGKEEEQYQDVMRKKKIVEADRAKLVQVMAELDEKKKKTLVAACEQVNKDFGSIFSTLLPGAAARLTPPAGRSVLDGLEVKVGFNDAWKESLGELSGGQRSLVALSLVLAMLLFKPAPLYILDEVDAALDLAHTQNIGHMLREHFTSSQFIIVSLKDGMFNNANVLFRTKFVDGMSSVQRTVNSRR